MQARLNYFLCCQIYCLLVLCILTCCVDGTVGSALTYQVRRQWTEGASKVNNWQMYNVWACNAPSFSDESYPLLDSVATYESETVVARPSIWGTLIRRTVTERILLFGGGLKESDVVNGNETWIFSPDLNSWWKVENENRPIARSKYRLVTLCNTKVFLLGGFSKIQQKSPVYLHDVWMFDSINEKWNEITVKDRNLSPLVHILTSAAVAGEDQQSKCHCNESIFFFSNKLDRRHVYKLTCVNDDLTYQWIKTTIASSSPVPTKYSTNTFAYNQTTHRILAMSDEGLWSYSTIDNIWQLLDDSVKGNVDALAIQLKNADNKEANKYILFNKEISLTSEIVWVYDVLKNCWSNKTILEHLPRSFVSNPPLVSFFGRLLTYMGTIKPCDAMLWEALPNPDNKVWIWSKIETQLLFPPTQIRPLTDMIGNRLYALGTPVDPNYNAFGIKYRINRIDFWQLNLNEMMWQRLTPFGDKSSGPIRDTENSVKGRLLHEGKIFVVCGEFLSVIKSASTSFQMQGYLFQIRVWLAYKSKNEPLPRNFYEMVAINDTSLLMFGGQTTTKLGKLVLTDETWIMTLRDLSDSFVYWVQVSQNSSAPQARIAHTMLKVTQDLVVLYGGSNGANKSCFNDVWHFNVSLQSWSPVFPVNQGPHLTTREYSDCYSTGTVVGSQIFFAVRCGENSTHCFESRISVGLQIWMYSPYSRSWSFVSAMQTRDNRWSYSIFYWQRNLFILDSANQQILHTRLGCPAGYESLDISSTRFPCKKCPIGYFSAAGATNCSRCPTGLMTITTTSTSVLDCSKCDVGQCEHGECLVLQIEAMPRPTCRCQFGYTGSSCQYATYYLIALGIVVFLSLLVVSVCTILYIRAKKRRREASLLKTVDELNTVWQIGDEEIELHERIGGGGFGDVFRARYRDLIVAVKILKCPEDEKVDYEFEREIQFMQTMRHSNIVMFLGAGRFTDSTNTPFIVIEYMENGSVRDLLDKVETDITEQQKLSFCVDVARGMRFLHTRNPPRIHRDLKCNNLLVSGNGTIKVADFGLGRQITGSRQAKVSNRTDTTSSTSLLMSVSDIGTTRWKAPELSARKAYSTAVDVYRYMLKYNH